MAIMKYIVYESDGYGGRGVARRNENDECIHHNDTIILIVNPLRQW